MGDVSTKKDVKPNTQRPLAEDIQWKNWADLHKFCVKKKRAKPLLEWYSDDRYRQILIRKDKIFINEQKCNC